MSDMYFHIIGFYKRKALMIILVSGLFMFFIFFTHNTSAQDAFVNTTSETESQSDSMDQDTKENLRVQLSDVEKQISDFNAGIEEAKKKQKSLKNDLNILDQQVKKQQLQIQEINLNLREIQKEITDTNNEINGLEGKLEVKRNLLDASLKKLNEYDHTSWVSVFLMSKSLSDFLNQIRYLHDLQVDINDFITNIDTIRADLESHKNELENKKSDILKLKSLQSLQQQTLQQKQKDKTNLLSTTKGQEKLYESGIKKSKKDIITIKQQLYTLESVGVSLSFDEAVKKAQFVGDKTGVRPAFILAIFQVESKLGTYVGGGSWRKDMKPSERTIFLQITSKLGLDPDTMPVSKRPYYGWGGAMGPAQFIPSTWMIYESQIASLTGHNPPSPWNIEDAFIASALKLASNGASSQAAKDEHTAAAKYLGGGNYKKTVSQNYANTVMDWAEYYQDEINTINGVGVQDVKKNTNS